MMEFGLLMLGRLLHGHAPSYGSGVGYGCSRGPRKCTYCHRENHTVDRCWDLHSRPAPHQVTTPIEEVSPVPSDCASRGVSIYE